MKRGRERNKSETGRSRSRREKRRKKWLERADNVGCTKEN
jgi:hypothetical protein